jgi:hypothetical protein
MADERETARRGARRREEEMWTEIIGENDKVEK